MADTVQSQQNKQRKDTLRERGREASLLGQRGSSVGTEALVSPLLGQEAQRHGVHRLLQAWLLGDLHSIVIGLATKYIKGL